MGKYIGETKSGSVNGITFSHNRYGQYMRRHAIPVNPNTAAQRSVRNAFGQASAVWRSLTETQKQGWKDGAMQFPSVNNIGDQIILDGHAFFVKVNTRRINAGMSALTDWDPSAYVPSLFEISGYNQDVFLVDQSKSYQYALTNESASEQLTPLQDFYGLIYFGTNSTDSSATDALKNNAPYVLKVSSGRSYSGGFVADSEFRVLDRYAAPTKTGSFFLYEKQSSGDNWISVLQPSGSYLMVCLSATQGRLQGDSSSNAQVPFWNAPISSLSGGLHYRFQLWTDNANKLTQDLIADFWMYVPQLEGMS